MIQHGLDTYVYLAHCCCEGTYCYRLDEAARFQEADVLCRLNLLQPRGERQQTQQHQLIAFLQQSQPSTSRRSAAPLTAEASIHWQNSPKIRILLSTVLAKRTAAPTMMMHCRTWSSNLDFLMSFAALNSPLMTIRQVLATAGTAYTAALLP